MRDNAPHSFRPIQSPLDPARKPTPWHQSPTSPDGLLKLGDPIGLRAVGDEVDLARGSDWLAACGIHRHHERVPGAADARHITLVCPDGDAIGAGELDDLPP